MKYKKNLPIAEAFYTDVCPELANPCIDALPIPSGYEDIYDMLEYHIPVKNENLPDFGMIRKRLIQNATRIFIPMGDAYNITEKILNAIIEGYVTRNPLTKQWNRENGELQSSLIENDVALDNFSASNANVYGFCIVGNSGMGKTTIVNRVLANIPQVIEHSKYKGHDFPFTQLTWLKVECPHDGGVKSLCMNFFAEFDRVLGDNYSQKILSSRANLDEMILRMDNLARRQNLGLFVIDEIQNIRSAKSGGAQRFKNLLTQMMNKLGIPILLIGTPSIVAELMSELITVRRFCGQGMVFLNFLNDNSSDWNLFTKKLWNYQYLKYKTDYSKELADELYKYSLGNIDATIKLFMETQICAIDSGVERINKEIIQKAAKSSSFLLVLRKIKEEFDVLEQQRKKSKTYKDVSEFFNSFDISKENKYGKIIKSNSKPDEKLVLSETVKSYDWHDDTVTPGEEL